MYPIAIIGPTCSGKNRLADYLEKEHGIPRIRTYTTRPRREEEDKDAYHFISQEKFDFMNERNFFLETASYQVATGDIWWYGSLIGDDPSAYPASTIILTPDGAVKARDHLSGILYLDAHPFTRYARGLARGDDPVELARRIGMESYEHPDQDSWSYFVQLFPWTVRRYQTDRTGPMGYSMKDVAQFLQCLY